MRTGKQSIRIAYATILLAFGIIFLSYQTANAYQSVTLPYTPDCSDYVTIPTDFNSRLKTALDAVRVSPAPPVDDTQWAIFVYRDGNSSPGKLEIKSAYVGTGSLATMRFSNQSGTAPYSFGIQLYGTAAWPIYTGTYNSITDSFTTPNPYAVNVFNNATCAFMTKTISDQRQAGALLPTFNQPVTQTTQLGFLPPQVPTTSGTSTTTPSTVTVNGGISKAEVVALGTKGFALTIACIIAAICIYALRFRSFR